MRGKAGHGLSATPDSVAALETERAMTFLFKSVTHHLQ